MPQVFVVYHKDSLRIKSDILEPIHVGRANATETNIVQLNDIIGDDTGDNISFKNDRYCELTAQYWAWKNCKSDYIGFFHYRRLFNLNNSSSLCEFYDVNNKFLADAGLNDSNINSLCQKFDIILPPVYDVHPAGFKNYLMTNYDFYVKFHEKKHIDLTISILKSKYPEYSESADEYFKSKKSFFFNMFIMRSDIFSEYMEWLFDILGTLEAILNEQNDQKQSRLYGFLSERLLNIFILYKMKNFPDLKLLHCRNLLYYSPCFKPVEFDKKRYIANLKRQEKIEKVKEPINIVFSTDNNYVQHFCAALISILLNSSSENFRVFVLDGGISDKNKQKIEKLKRVKDFNIEYLNIDNGYFSDLPLNRSYISIATYYRLLLPEILPTDVKKVIYLDCDVIVKTDIAEMWNENLEGYLAAAIEDEGCISQIKRLNLPDKNSYFNAGVMFFNIDELRKLDFQNMWKTYFKQNEDIILLQDQDILNGVLNGRCKFLSLRWNANGRLYSKNNLLEHFYSYEDADSAAHNPAIIHYTDKNKPWMKLCSHPLQKEYFKYLLYTPFKYKVPIYLIRMFVFKPIAFLNAHRKSIISVRFNKKEKSVMLFGKKICFS